MKTVLLLDDDAELRSLLKVAVEAHGLRVLEAGSGQQAQDILDNHAVDVVVVDGLLPDIPGTEFIERVRRSDSQLRFVFLSAFFRDLQTIRRLTQELDVSLVAYKPVDPSNFAAKLVALTSDSQPSVGSKRLAAVEESSVVNLEFELAALREQFGKGLPGKIADLTASIQRGKSDPNALTEARMLAHRLRGSCGSYGFAEVGYAAGVAEDLLIAALQQPAPPKNFWDAVSDAVRDMHFSAVRPAPGKTGGSQRPQSLQKSLLVVDDDPDFLTVVKALSRKLAVNVVTAQSGAEAIQHAEALSLVGVILDVHLHEDESFSLARQIRDTRGNGEIPIAFASVDGRIETRVAALEAGGSKFFDKPTSESSFAELVQHFLQLSESRQARILIVDDDADLVRQYTLLLRGAGFVVEALFDTEKLVEKLEETRPDVLLLDVNLPTISGIDVCRALRMSQQWEFLPILLITSDRDPDIRIRAFRAGASDVIAKPVIPDELLARVGVQEERNRLIRDRADRDPLSGLMLRRAFSEAFQAALAGCARQQKSLSLVLCDLDAFKQTNDQYGHLAGDLVIAGFGDLVRRRFRIDDLRGRWGGEEFVLVFPGQSAEFAVQSTLRLLGEFSGLRFDGENSSSFGVTFTAGVATYPDDGMSMGALIRRADERMYLGKLAGRNRVIGPDSPNGDPIDPLELRSYERKDERP